MARYIDACSLRDKVSESLKDNPHRVDIVARNHNYEHAHFLMLIDDEPTADVQEVKHGEWVSNAVTDEYVCSECDGIAPVDCEKEDFYESNYCPNCGAKMRKE